MVTANQKPKHKPSEKHTLEEVLKSLQDLIRNDIIDGDESSPTAAATPPLTQKGGPPPQATTAQHSTDAETADETDIDAVLDSLKDLIVHELESPETEAEQSVTEQESPSDQVEEITFEAPDATALQVEEEQPPDIDTKSPAPPSPPAADADITTDITDKDASAVQTGQSELQQPPAPPGGAQETFAFDEPLPTIEVEETSLADMPDIDFSALEAPTAPETEEHTPDRAEAPPEDAVELTSESEAEPLTAPDTPVTKKEEGTGLTDTPETRKQKLEATDVGDEKETPLTPQDATTRDEEAVVADVPASDIPADMDTEEFAEVSFDALPEDLSSIPSIEFENVLKKTEETPAPETDDHSQEKPSSAPLPKETPPEMPVAADTVEAPEQVGAETLEKDTPPTASVDYPSPAGLEVDVTPEVAPKETPQPVAEKPTSSDDIPVLDEVAAKPPEASLPTPDRAREIAIKIIAKLNIELRKCGERGLSPATIDRLQYLLREALEHGTGNKNR